MIHENKLFLASDNWAPAHPLILESVVNANKAFAASYGGDLWTLEAQGLIQKAFKSDCKVLVLPTGTGSNHILSLGGTKNGLMCAEALLIFNSDLESGSDYYQKQTLQLLSKMRYLSPQYIPFFKNDLWKTLASQANQRAQEIALIINEIPHLSFSYPFEANQIFFTDPSSWILLIQEKFFCYPWDLEKKEVRFIASWIHLKRKFQNLK